MGTEADGEDGDGGAARLDRFDRAILALYHADTRRVAEDIGREVGLSAAAVQRRIRRLRETGVIRAEVARLDAHALGFPITCVVGVDVENERAEHIDGFKRKMAALPNVQHCWYVTGAWDFVVVVKARDMMDYERFTREVFLNDPNVRSFTTHVAMDEVKAGFGLPF